MAKGLPHSLKKCLPRDVKIRAGMNYPVKLLAFATAAIAQTQPAADPNRALLQRYCVGCHNNSLKTAGVGLQGLDLSSVSGIEELLEKVLRTVKTGQMPPPWMPQPTHAGSTDFR